MVISYQNIYNCTLIKKKTIAVKFQKFFVFHSRMIIKICLWLLFLTFVVFISYLNNIKYSFSNIFKDCKIRFENSTFYSNQKYVDSTMTFFEDDNSEAMFNMTINQKVDMIKEVLLVSFNRPKDEFDRNYQLSILKTSIDLCKISQGVLSNVFVKTFMENFFKSSDYQMKCPFLKGLVINHKIYYSFITSVLCRFIQYVQSSIE